MTRLRTILPAAAAAALLAAAPAAAAPNDPLYDKQWGPQQVNAEQAWSQSTGDGTTIAIVDSGIDLAHPDLRDKIAGGATFSGCQGSGPCGNGDWDSPDGKGDPHGTHVAGIAAASTDNGIGIAGVAPDAKLLAVKVLDEDGSGSFEEIAAGIRWSVDNGADVINLSLGGLPGQQVLELTGILPEAKEAIAYAREKGVVVVAAAGNEVAGVCASPSFNDGALCVTATDPNEAPAWYTNFGVKPDMQVVAAPGGAGTFFCEDDVLSTVPEGEEEFCAEGEGYDAYAGTSMAAPHVSGVAALLLAQGRTDENTLDAIMSTARAPIVGVTGTIDPVYGHGIVDAEAAVAAEGASDPGEPSDPDEPEDPGSGSGKGKPDHGDKPGNGHGRDRDNPRHARGHERS
jgi:subtilisin family serine protease